MAEGYTASRKEVLLKERVAKGAGCADFFFLHPPPLLGGGILALAEGDLASRKEVLLKERVALIDQLLQQPVALIFFLFSSFFSFLGHSCVGGRGIWRC